MFPVTTTRRASSASLVLLGLAGLVGAVMLLATSGSAQDKPPDKPPEKPGAPATPAP
ncbi:MAG: hypothetical protein JWP63_6107, partial [Candidatus Solibacter sp.]|nr:hypothetical protein [Candidatus Solibacter sp.]